MWYDETSRNDFETFFSYEVFMSIDSSSKAALHKGYKHWCPEVEPREDWDKDFNFVLIRSIEELKKLDVEHKFVAWDTETSGLNPDIDWLVGFSFSFDGKTGYYVPVKHDDIALGKEALDIFFSILSKAGTQFLYNCRFDQRFFEAAGYSLEGLRYYDVMNAIWLADTNVLMPSLKVSERRFLGWIPKTFSETLGDATTFQHVPAEDAYKYACLDENELIMMGDMSTKRICEIEVGDMVCTPNGPRKVTAVYNNGILECYRLVWNDGSATIATGNHKFLFHGKDTGEEVWQSVDEVFSLYQKDQRSSLNAIRITPEGKHSDFLLCGVSKFRTCNVYDIQVEEVHCFVMTNGIISHNCTDALGTYHLALISNQFYKESYPASKYDNDALYPMMRLENTPQRLDLEYLKSLCSSVETRIDESLQQVYQLAGCTFNVNSPAQFGKIMLERFGVDTGVRTPTGAMKADLKTLEAWMVKHGSKASPEVKDFLSAYKEYKKTVKFKSSYLDKYIKAAEDADTFPIRFSYKFQSVPCLTENNTVLTKSRGFVSIKDVQSEDMIWTAWGYKRVLWNHSHEVDEFYRVTLKNGMILEGTGHHPVLVRKSPLEKVAYSGMTKDDVEWAGIQDLKPDEPVVINHTPASISCKDSWRSSLARIMGYFYGKGKMTDGILMSLCFDNKDLAYHYYGWMKSLFGDKKVSRYDVDKGKVEYSITRQTLTKFLSEHNVIPTVEEDHLGNLKVSPVSTYTKVADGLSRTPDTFRHFLAGYLDSAKTSVRELGYKEIPDDWEDGITKDRVTFVIPSACKDVIIPMFWASAIDCKVTDHTFKTWFGEGKVTRVEVSDPYSLSNLLSLWDNTDVGLIRFSCVELPKTFRLYAESRVQSVERVHANTVVYDIEVEDVHEFVAGGIVTHNTGRLSCGGDKKNSFFTQNNVQCLEEDTSVITSEGIKPIKQVNTGDLVWTGSEFAPCQQLGSKTCGVLKISTDCGEVICSAEHLILVSDSRHEIGEFRHAGDLKVGQFMKHVGKVLSSDDRYSPARIDRIESAGEAVCYDLFVPKFERFVANGFIVHNSTPKPHSLMVKGRKATQEEINQGKDILGWYLSNDIPDDEAVGLVEGMDPDHFNLRRAFLPKDDDCYVVSIDMKAEELRLVANIYNEKTWADAFIHGKDVHKACYSPDTEFLVLDHGWMTADRITKGMKIAYYDPMDDEVRFTKAGERYSHEASEVYMHPTLFNVTDNHRMWIGTQDAGFRIVRASELKSQGNPKQTFRMKTAVGQRKSFQSIESHFGRKLGQYFCYGFMYFAPHYYDEEGFVHITLDSPCTKIPHDFALFLHSGDFSSTEFSVDRELSLGFRSLEASNPCTYLFSLAKTEYKDEPIFLQDFVYGMLVYLSSTKFNTLNLGDGSKVSGKVVVSSKEHADAIQWLLMLTGSTCRVDPSKSSVYGEGAYVLTIFSDVSSLPKSLGSTFGSVKKKNIAEKHLTYSCFSVPSGLLVTRYKGQITVNGNTAIKLFGEENYSKEARKKAKCVAGDTILHTAEGHTIAIRDLVSVETLKNAVIGEPVELPEPKTRISTPDGWSPVTHWISNGKKDTLKLIIERQLTLEVTPDHLVGKYDPDASDGLSKKYRLVRADSLSVGDRVLWDYCPMRITDIQKGSSDVYDITVDNASHTFHANGVVVHNCASFGILYGSGAQGFNNSFPDMTLDECRQFLAKFKEALPSIEQGQTENVAYAREHGTINTGYGRQRRVRSYFQSGDRAQIAFAERTVKNSVVQGTAADVLKLIFCRLWANVFKPYPDVTFMSTIHDEVNFSMPKRLAREVIPICMECMTIRRDDWPVTLECSLSIGRDSLGDLIPFTYNKETKEFTPEWEESSEVLKKRTGHVETKPSDNDALDVEECEDPYFGLPPEACEF